MRRVPHHLCGARFYPEGAHIDSQSDGAAIRCVKSVNTLKEQSWPYAEAVMSEALTGWVKTQTSVLDPPASQALKCLVLAGPTRETVFSERHVNKVWIRSVWANDYPQVSTSSVGVHLHALVGLYNFYSTCHSSTSEHQRTATLLWRALEKRKLYFQATSLSSLRQST